MHGWSALILAGGAGRRFAADGAGGRKLLADLGGAPVIRRVADKVAGAGFSEVVIVTGADAAAAGEALAGLDCRIIAAPDWAEGMAATLRTGIRALAPDAAGVCIFLGDMPLVPMHLCESLVNLAQRSGFAARPRLEGRPGHPVAFTRAAFAELLTLKGDEGAAALLKARGQAVAYCDTAERGVLFDIDTPGDLSAARAAWNT